MIALAERQAAYAARCCDWHEGDGGGRGDPEQPCRGERYPGRAQTADAKLYRMPPSERYRRDPEFCNLVNYMHAMIHRAQFSPSELREAAMLAAIMYEERRSDSRYTLSGVPIR